MQLKSDANRCVKLTDSGVRRLEAARRKYRKTVEDIAGGSDTPSINTIKRALRKGPVFVSTLERIWHYFRKCSSDQRETLPYLIEDEDYFYVESEPRSAVHNDEREPHTDVGKAHPGWISRNVPRPNRLFTGRRDVLEILHIALKDSPAALVADPQALTGLAGIGKTQTAIAYIYAHLYDYDHVFWVSSETINDLNDGLAGLAEELGLMTAAPATKKAALTRMHDWFRTESNWLLVLDNADDVETLAPHFPRHHSGCLILTTRARNTVKWAAPISLAQFGPRDGATLVLRRAGILSAKASIEEAPEAAVKAAIELNQVFAGLPLALDQAGAYLAQTGCTVAEYLGKYQSLGLELIDSAVDPEHAPVVVTFRLAVEQMAQRNRCGAGALQMIRLCAFLSPDAIPEPIFKSFPLANPGLDEADLYSEVCSAVCGYSLASRNIQNETVTVHRLVQKVTRDSLSEQERQIWAANTVQAVSAATPDFEFEDWGLCDLLLPQWRLCAGYIREGNIETRQAAYLLYQAGRYLRARALYDEAEGCTGLALTIAEQAHGKGHSITADYLDELACLYRVLDRRVEAEALHLRAIAILENMKGPDDALVASKLHNMALLYTHSEEYLRAEPIFLRALAIYEKQPVQDPHLIATTLTQIAGVYRCTAEFDKAEACCRRALEIYESLLAPNHIDIATATNNLGLLYLTMGRYTDAELQYERALRINQDVRGDNHPETGTVLWGLARVRWKLGQISEAEDLFQRAIRIYTDHFGKEHTRAARMLQSYVEFLQENRMNPSSGLLAE